jgi:hypothetical protein
MKWGAGAATLVIGQGPGMEEDTGGEEERLPNGEWKAKGIAWEGTDSGEKG